MNEKHVEEMQGLVDDIMKLFPVFIASMGPLDDDSLAWVASSWVKACTTIFESIMRDSTAKMVATYRNKE